MFDAVHKKSGKGYYPPTIWDVFDDPYSEDWICCPEEDKKVTPVKAYRRKDGVLVSAHFRHAKGTSEKCKYAGGGGEGELHRKYKNLLVSLIKSDEIDFVIEGEPLELEKDFDTSRFMADLTHKWESISLNDVEKEKYTEDKKRRPDLRIPFNSFHPFFGKGLAIEIQLSDQTEKKKQNRTEDILNNLWSVVWLHEQQFEDSNNSFGISTNEIKINYPFLKCFVKRQINSLSVFTNDVVNLKSQTQDEIDRIERSMNMKINSLLKKTLRSYRKTCRTCKYGRPHKEKRNGEYVETDDDRIDCHYLRIRKNIKEKPRVHEPLDSCDNWRRKGK